MGEALYSEGKDGKKFDRWIWDELLGDDAEDDDYRHDLKPKETSLTYRARLALLLRDGEFREEDHPRDESGKFTSSGSDGEKSSVHGERKHDDETVRLRLNQQAALALVTNSYLPDSPRTDIDLGVMSIADRIAFLEAHTNEQPIFYNKDRLYYESATDRRSPAEKAAAREVRDTFDRFEAQARREKWDGAKVLEEGLKNGLISLEKKDNFYQASRPMVTNYWQASSTAEQEALEDGWLKAAAGSSSIVAAEPSDHLTNLGWSTADMERFADKIDATGASSVNFYREVGEDEKKVYTSRDLAAMRMAFYSKNFENFEPAMYAGWAAMGGSDTTHLVRSIAAEAFPHADGKEFYQFQPPSADRYRSPEDAKAGHAEFQAQKSRYSPRAVEHIKRVKAETEAHFKKKLDQDVVVLRGVGGVAEAYTPASVESWTIDPKTVDRFGKMMTNTGEYTALKSTIKYRDILWTSRTAKGKPGWPPDKQLKGKQEVVTLGRGLTNIEAEVRGEPPRRRRW